MLLYFLYCVRYLVFRSFLFVWLLSFLMNKDIYKESFDFEVSSVLLRKIGKTRRIFMR